LEVPPLLRELILAAVVGRADAVRKWRLSVVKCERKPLPADINSSPRQRLSVARTSPTIARASQQLLD